MYVIDYAVFVCFFQRTALDYSGEVKLKKFSFRLQTVLELREKTLDEKRKKMAEVVAALNERLEYLKKLKTKYNETQSSLEYLYSEGNELNIQEVTGYKNYLGSLSNDMANESMFIQKLNELLRLKQLEVTEALKDVKVLEKLKNYLEN